MPGNILNSAAIVLLQGADLRSMIGKMDENNPTLTLLTLLLGTFLAGFGTRKFFEDRELSKLRLHAEETKEKAAAVDIHLQDFKESQEAANERAERIARFISADGLRRSLAEQLRHWPVEQHDGILVAVVRQLLLTPGTAWLCNPDRTLAITADWDTTQNAAKVTTSYDAARDPVAEIRTALVGDEAALRRALLDVNLFGLARVRKGTAPGHIRAFTVRNGPSQTWQTIETVYAVEKSPSRSSA